MPLATTTSHRVEPARRIGEVRPGRRPRVSRACVDHRRRDVEAAVVARRTPARANVVEQRPVAAAEVVERQPSGGHRTTSATARSGAPAIACEFQSTPRRRCPVLARAGRCSSARRRAVDLSDRRHPRPRGSSCSAARPAPVVEEQVEDASRACSNGRCELRVLGVAGVVDAARRAMPAASNSASSRYSFAAGPERYSVGAGRAAESSQPLASCRRARRSRSTSVSGVRDAEHPADRLEKRAVDVAQALRLDASA